MHTRPAPRRLHSPTWLVALVSVLAGIASSPLTAQATVATNTGSAYRCRDAQGQVSYTQRPCAEDAQAMRFADARTAAQQRQAASNTERDAKLARHMTRAQRKAERDAPAATLITSHKPLPQPQAATSQPHGDRVRPRRHRVAESPYFTARTQVTPKTPAGTSSAKPGG